MRKFIYLSMIIFFTGYMLSGCMEKFEPQSNPEPNKVQTEQGNNEQPHQFGGFQGAGQEFSGGSTVSNYNLSSVRRVPHPEFIRLVYEFTGGDSGEYAEAPPDYTVRLEKDSLTIDLILNGVTKADIMKNKQQVIGLSKLFKDISFTPTDDLGGIVSLELYGPVTFQVFDLRNPARVVVVLKPEGGQFDEL